MNNDQTALELNDGPPRRSWAWWVFCMPGAAIMWVEYMFPRHGQVYASARRQGNPLIQVIYSLGFYGITAIFSYAYLFDGR